MIYSLILASCFMWNGSMWCTYTPIHSMKGDNRSYYQCDKFCVEELKKQKGLLDVTLPE